MLFSVFFQKISDFARFLALITGLTVLSPMAVSPLNAAPDAPLEKLAELKQWNQDYSALLKEVVTPTGGVHYRDLKKGKAAEELIRLTSALENFSSEVRSGWQRDTQISFFVNAYNILTLKAIADHYPIESSFFRSWFYPENSIRQIDGVWDELKFPVGEKKLTLDEIEHSILRPRYNDPGIHVALVCAAKSCPPLRREAYTGDKWADQVKDQIAAFFQKSENFQCSLGTPKIRLSKIFYWFKEDFQKYYQARPENKNKEIEPLAAILDYLGEKGPADIQNCLAQPILEADYSDYDWSLNEAPPAR